MYRRIYSHYPYSVNYYKKEYIYICTYNMLNKRLRIGTTYFDKTLGAASHLFHAVHDFFFFV